MLSHGPQQLFAESRSRDLFSPSHGFQQLFEYFSFNKAGKQRIEVKQATSQYNLEGIHAFAIHIEKAELDIEKIMDN